MTVGRLSVACWVVFVAMSIGFLPGLALAAVVGESSPFLGYVAAVVVFVVWWGPFVYAMYLSQIVMRKGDPRLLKRGVRGTALVLDAKQTNTVIQSGEFEWQAPFVYRYQLRVSLPGKAPYETYCRICLSGIQEGSNVAVAVSPHNRKRVTIDPGSVTADAGYGAGTWDTTTFRFDPVTGAPAPRPPTAPAPHPTPEDARLDALTQLADLRDRRALTDAEFEAEKARLLGGDPPPAGMHPF